MRVIIQFDKKIFRLWLSLFVVILIHSSKCVEFTGETYGNEWVYFLDMDGNKRYVDMTVSLISYRQLRFGGAMSRKFGYKVNFWLYTRKNINDHQLLNERYINDSNLKNMYFVAGKPLVMVTHGWMVNGNSNATQFIKNAYLEHHDVNVIVVDWGNEATADYTDAVLKLPHLAAEVREMVMALSKRFAFDGSAVHLIGHSLGAHLISYAGAQLKRRGFIVARLTGLDPARPFFEKPPEVDGISLDSAAFVDIIHTNIGLLGIANARGHADFYPNGGNKQKPCCSTGGENGIMSDLCDHGCAYIYYKESIRHGTFKSRKCNSYDEFLSGSCDKNEEGGMGEPCDSCAHGKFYLKIDKLPSN